MPTDLTLRLNVYLRSDSTRVTWALLGLNNHYEGVPDARLMLHGAFDQLDHDLVGINAVVQALTVAVDEVT